MGCRHEGGRVVLGRAYSLGTHHFLACAALLGPTEQSLLAQHDPSQRGSRQNPNHDDCYTSGLAGRALADRARDQQTRNERASPHTCPPNGHHSDSNSDVEGPGMSEWGEKFKSQLSNGIPPKKRTWPFGM